MCKLQVEPGHTESGSNVIVRERGQVKLPCAIVEKYLRHIPGEYLMLRIKDCCAQKHREDLKN